MSRVMVITSDHDVRIVLAFYLKKHEGHVVVATPDGWEALDLLRDGRRSAVVIVHFPDAPLPSSPGLALLQEAAEDTSGRLARRRYIVLLPGSRALQQTYHSLLSQLNARTFTLPFDLEEVADAVERAS